MVETQQVEQLHKRAELQEKVEQHDAAIEMKLTPQLSELAPVQKLHEQVTNLKTLLAESEKRRQGCL